MVQDNSWRTVKSKNIFIIWKKIHFYEKKTIDNQQLFFENRIWAALAAQIRFFSIQFDWLRPSWSLQLFQDQFQCSRCGCYQSIFSVAFIVFFCHVLVRRAQCSKIWFPPCFLHGQSTEVFFFVCAKLCSVWFPALLFVLVAVSSCDTLDFPENTHLKNTELPFRIFIQRPGSRVV